MTITYLYLGMFGLIGVFARYFINSHLPSLMGYSIPTTTLTINILGSFLIGVIYILSVDKLLIGEDLRIGLITGLLGGFTTFSAFSLETIILISEGQYFLSTLYVLCSVGGGVLAAAFGLYVGKNLVSFI